MIGESFTSGYEMAGSSGRRRGGSWEEKDFFEDEYRNLYGGDEDEEDEEDEDDEDDDDFDEDDDDDEEDEEEDFDAYEKEDEGEDDY